MQGLIHNKALMSIMVLRHMIRLGEATATKPPNYLVCVPTILQSWSKNLDILQLYVEVGSKMRNYSR